MEVKHTEFTKRKEWFLAKHQGLSKTLQAGKLGEFPYNVFFGDLIKAKKLGRVHTNGEMVVLYNEKCDNNTAHILLDCLHS